MYQERKKKLSPPKPNLETTYCIWSCNLKMGRSSAGCYSMPARHSEPWRSLTMHCVGSARSPLSNKRKGVHLRFQKLYLAPASSRIGLARFMQCR